MSGQDQYPIAGQHFPQFPPPGAPSGNPASLPQDPSPQRPLLRAAHKPGAVPLRPLGLADVFDAAVRIIRVNPGATVGAAVLLAGLPMLIPVLVTALQPSLFDTGLLDSEELSSGQAAGIISIAVSWALALGLQWLGTIACTAMVVHVVHAAALGQKLSFAQAWHVTRGLRWRVVVLSLVLGLMSSALVLIYVLVSIGVVMTGNLAVIVVWFLVSLPLFAAAMLWFWVKIYLFAVPVLMMERTGVITAITRGSSLMTGHFWRVLGTALLTVVALQFAASVISIPLGFIGEAPLFMGAGAATIVLVFTITQAVSLIVVAALTTPFLAAVISLLYLDVRIRKEAFDVELLTRAGFGPP